MKSESNDQAGIANKRRGLKYFAAALVIVGLILAFVFGKSFGSDQVLFSNDGPLGVLVAEYGSMKHAFYGVWNDLNWVGIESPTALPNTAAVSWFLLGNDPVTFAKFHVPVAQLGLGLSLWFLLRQFGFHAGVCAIAAIAAALNMNIFSHSCWGLPSRAWTLASTFLALAALVSGTKNRPLLKALLAGLAVSNGIMEGFDVGAIFSLYVAAFAIFAPFAPTGEVNGGTAAKAILRVTIVAVFAALCAAAALYTLIGTQVIGVANTKQDPRSQERWDGATMWSLPKSETARVLVPGLFGYRMDTPEGGNYWGAVGQSPGVPQSRHSGAGEYAGALVLLLAAFAVANAFRKTNNPYNPFERRIVLFFAGAAVISLLLAWGRHAPFYQIVYALPYFSTIRNPIKFMHPFHMAVLILFGFGLEATLRLYALKTKAPAGSLVSALKAFWEKAPVFERRWMFASLAFVGIMLISALIYSSSSREMTSFLQAGGFPQPLAGEILSFSQSELFLALLYTAASVLVLILALTGWFSGQRLKFLLVIFGTLLTVDMVRANRPWIQYYDYKTTYAANPVTEFLKQKAHEHRATARLAPFFSRYLVDPAKTQFFDGVANNWLQTLFQYYNIQSLEPVQMPRTPELDDNYFRALAPGQGRPPGIFIRMWELTNTRYLMGDKETILSFFQALEPGKQRARVVLTFDATLKPGANPQGPRPEDIVWVQNEGGRFGIVEFTGALPRVFLAPSWRENVTDEQALAELASPAFDPHGTVLLSGKAGLPTAPPTNFQGSVEITSYSPRKIALSASNSAPAMLVYNDKFSPYWNVSVDDKTAPMQRANYIMRGIPLAAGSHKIQMVYQPPLTGLYVSLMAIVAGLVGLGLVLFLPPSLPVLKETSPAGSPK